jgi:hypothetical protein
MSLASWPAAFLVTVLVEVPIMVAVLRATPAPAWKLATTALVAQLATHPVVWFVFPQIGALSHGQSLWVSELWAWLVEAWLLARALPGVGPIDAAGVSALANGASLGVGVLIRAYSGGYS